ncbi:SGNH hydrolase domain-containing protein [Ruegeria sp.]|uniref:SGNH hydrolase domain-containing protein n=1 Tax=Ruegeria sp. TaxID=1879320 RepID=UPI003B5CF38B
MGVRRAEMAAAGEAPTGIRNNPIHVKQGVERLLQRLNDRKVDVVVVGSIPEAGLNVPDAHAASFTFGTRLRALPTREEFDRGNEPACAILLEGSRKFGTILARPVDDLCESSCRVLENGDPIYLDEDHLNQAGARLLVSTLLNQHLAHILSGD